MNQDFRLKYERLLENDPTEAAGTGETGSLASANAYASSSMVRNIGFIWPDGRKLFLNYSYLVSCEFNPASASLLLAFTTHTVTIHGLRLDALFDELMAQIPRLIICTDVRYNLLADEGPVINAIEVLKAE